MTEYNEDDLVLISAIEHFSYCPRQCALIHVEKVFDENVFTLRGSRSHERTDDPKGMEEHGVRVEKALPVWSERYGLYGKADMVEFSEDGVLYPVEYKFGEKRVHGHDDLQLCAQALCLEEMFGCSVERGAVYHCSSHQRREVEFTEALRKKTIEAVEAIRAVHKSGKLPPPVDDERCPNCSLVHACLPSGVSILSGMKPDAIFIPRDAEVAE
jgi:CRISPR-associated exonuclease Cas4